MITILLVVKKKSVVIKPHCTDSHQSTLLPALHFIIKGIAGQNVDIGLFYKTWDYVQWQKKKKKRIISLVNLKIFITLCG